MELSNSKSAHLKIYDISTPHLLTELFLLKMNRQN